MPGPLFTFSAYLGAIEEPSPNGVAGAAHRRSSRSSCRRSCSSAACCRSGRRSAPARLVQAAVTGIGAAVVGLLAAALWDPVLTTSIDDAWDVAFALGLLVLLRLLPVWAVVPIAAAAGALAF